jgi:hypothetical protein
MVFVLVLTLLIEAGKKLWKRRQANKNAGALPE